MKLPHSRLDAIPGEVMEGIIALVHNAKGLNTYDYVDVCLSGDVGWSVKSTKSETPLTWKRAKIGDALTLIDASRIDPSGLQALGDSIIDFCNKHAKESIDKYDLKQIMYSRLIMFNDGSAVYFEKLISTIDNPNIFNKSNYTWQWSTPKTTVKKEQLQALHGTEILSKQKAFAWHGLGENQLHFSGEKAWWPEITIPPLAGTVNYSADGHAIAFRFPSDKVSWEFLRGFTSNSN